MKYLIILFALSACTAAPNWTCDQPQPNKTAGECGRGSDAEKASTPDHTSPPDDHHSGGGEDNSNHDNDHQGNGNSSNTNGNSGNSHGNGASVSPGNQGNHGKNHD